jgi:archaemetzincin
MRGLGCLAFVCVVAACRPAPTPGGATGPGAPAPPPGATAPAPPPAPAEADVVQPRAVRERALGSLARLSPPLRRAFDPAGFTPLHRPGPNDWLASHPEPGQTFDEYLASRPNTPDQVRRVIDLWPLGDFPADRSPPLPPLVAYAGAFFGLEARALPAAPVATLKVKTRINQHTRKRQLLTADILQALRGHLRPDAYCLAAITMEDLYPAPSWNFVFGEASLRDRVGVHSFARYDPAFLGEPRGAGYRDLILRRGLKVMVHELGHMFGLDHCVYFECLMNGSNHLDEADARPQHLCPVCLRKLHHAVGFDPAARYRALERLYRAAGMTADADVVSARAARITAP